MHIVTASRTSSVFWDLVAEKRNFVAKKDETLLKRTFIIADIFSPDLHLIPLPSRPRACSLSPMGAQRLQ